MTACATGIFEAKRRSRSSRRSLLDLQVSVRFLSSSVFQKVWAVASRLGRWCWKRNVLKSLVFLRQAMSQPAPAMAQRHTNSALWIGSLVMLLGVLANFASFLP